MFPDELEFHYLNFSLTSRTNTQLEVGPSRRVHIRPSLLHLE